MPKKNAYQKQDKILSQMYNYETASQPTTNVTINVFLPGLKREISIILAISVLQKTLIRSNIKVEIVIVFLPTSRKYC